MNKTMLFSFALFFTPIVSYSMGGHAWQKMRPKDDTSGLFVRQEFNYATGDWEDELTGDGKTEDWLWLEHEQKYVRVNALAHKDFRKIAQHNGEPDTQQENQARSLELSQAEEKENGAD